MCDTVAAIVLQRFCDSMTISDGVIVFKIMSASSENKLPLLELNNPSLRQKGFGVENVDGPSLRLRYYGITVFHASYLLEVQTFHSGIMQPINEQNDFDSPTKGKVEQKNENHARRRRSNAMGAQTQINRFMIQQA